MIYHCPGKILLFLLLLLLLITSGTLAASNAIAQNTPTAGLYGALGLNTVPNARMEQAGTVRFSASTSDPYWHGVLGIQIADPLYIGLRQTAQISSLRDKPERFFPGVDIRLRLWEETPYTPQIALGLQSAFGHKRMAAETLTLSKGFGAFDISGGLAWGRLGSAAHVSNPLKIINSHFGKSRAADGESPNAINDWFTGEDIGFFAGIEYFTPLDGLSLKADWGADDYIAERAITGFRAPEPWSVGLSYRPLSTVDIGAALIDGDKIMASLNLRAPVEKWPGRSYKKTDPPVMRPYRTGLALPNEMRKSALRDDIILHNVMREGRTVAAMMPSSPSAPTPLQIGRAARHMANHAGPHTESIAITPRLNGLSSRTISLNRRDLEQALARHQGSPQEIWRSASFTSPDTTHDTALGRFTGLNSHYFNIALDQAVSLSEDDNGLIHRSGLLLEHSGQITDKIWSSNSLRIGIFDNVDRIRDYRPRTPLPVRSNIDDFAARRIGVERSYMGWLTTLKPDLHLSLKAGYLEEMYAGLGGEILYRPFGKTFAIGAEGWWALKRDPLTSLNLGFNGDRLLTGHLQAWYEIPGTDMTIQARIGRYLAEDIGATLALNHNFKNGAVIEAFATATDQADFDVFGSQTHLYSGLKMKFPLGNVPYLPITSDIRFKAEPFGRDTGQSIDTPMPLYELTEPLSYRHIARHWNMVVE